MYRNKPLIRTYCRNGLLGILLMALPMLTLSLLTGFATEPSGITYKNGDVYVGEMVNGQRHGQGSYTFHDGKRYVGEWQHDKRHGRLHAAVDA